MPTVIVPNATLPDLNGLTGAKPADQSAAASFLSVLSNVENGPVAPVFDNTAGLADHQPQPQEHDDDKEKDVPPQVAAAVQVPLHTFINDTQPKQDNEPTVSESKTTSQANGNDNTDKAQPVDRGNDPQPSRGLRAANDDQANTPDQSAPVSNLVKAADATAGKEDAPVTEKEVRNGLQAQLTAIDQILTNIIQLLTGGAVTPVASIATPAVVSAAVPATPAMPAIPAIAGTPAQPATPAIPATPAAPAGNGLQAILAVTLSAPVAGISLTPATAVQSPALLSTSSTIDANTAANLANLFSTNGSTTDAVTLLKDIQSLVQQLQQQLQPQAAAPTADDSQPQATPQTTDTGKLQTIADLLGADVAKLSQYLGNKPAASVDLGNDPKPAIDLSQLGAALKDSITKVREQLQQLQSANDNVFQRALANFRAQLTQVAPDSNTPKNSNDNNAPVPVASAVVAAPLVQNTPVTSVTQPQQVTPQAAPVDVAQNGANNSGSDTSGNNGGQNQSAPAPVATSSPVSNSAQTSSPLNISFSKMLDQVQTPRPLMEQVMFNVKTALDDGSSRIHIQLDPAELGKLDIKLDVGADGKTGVIITADNKDTLILLQRDTQNLTRALNDAGLMTDSGSLSFNLRSGQDNGQGQGSSLAAMNYQKSQPEEEDNTTINAISRSYVVNLAEGLDITI